MRYAIGIDGGGTKTALIACTDDGRILCDVQTKGTNLCAQQQAEAKETLFALLNDCRVNYGAPSAVCMGAAGMVGDRVGNVLKSALVRASECENVLVLDDAKISLYANFSRGAGLSLTAGTGSICVAQNAAGELFRAGGWGHLVSDEGSAYDIVRRALIAAVRAHDEGRGDMVLLQELCRRTGSGSFEELIEAVYRDYAEKSAFASLADTVSECARMGDETATAVLQEAADRLFALCSLVVKRSGLEREPFEACFNGGVLAHVEAVWNRLAEKLSDNFGCKVRRKTERAVFGALALARERMNER